MRDTCPLVVFKNKTSSLFLNSFKFVNTILCMGRPYCCCIVQNWFNIYLISISSISYTDSSSYVERKGSGLPSDKPNPHEQIIKR